MRKNLLAVLVIVASTIVSAQRKLPLGRALEGVPEQYQKYADLAPPIIGKFGGKFLARGGKFKILEGRAVQNVMSGEVPIADIGSPTRSLRRRESCSGGILRPSALAVLIDHKFKSGSACSIGRSAGLLPFSILLVKYAARRYKVSMFTHSQSDRQPPPDRRQFVSIASYNFFRKLAARAATGRISRTFSRWYSRRSGFHQ